MKGLFLGLFLMLGGVLYAAGRWEPRSAFSEGRPTEKLAEVRDAGIGYVEVTFHAFTHKTPDAECYAAAFALRDRLDKAGLKVWSCHLPFGRNCDISVVDPEQREPGMWPISSG